MPSIHIQPFGGMLPKLSSSLLGAEGAQIASNVKLMSGELRAWRKPLKITANIVDNCLSLYRLYGSSASQWLSWAADVDVVGSPLSDATDHRIYYTGDATPRKTNFALATDAVTVTITGPATPAVVTQANHGRAANGEVIFSTTGALPAGLAAGSKYYVSAAGLTTDTYQLSATAGGASIGTTDAGSGTHTAVGPYPTSYLEMGVPPLSAAATAAITVSGTGTPETRAYLVTHVSTFGSIKEESAPLLCNPATLSVPPVGSTVRVNAYPALPSGRHNITHRRIYRTMIGTSDYAFLAEIPVATTYYDDTITLGVSPTLLASTYYTPPPAGLKGLVSMPNGMVAGFVNNEVWFCEPYKPHAWPSVYMQTVDYPIMGLGVYGSALVALTERIPYVFYGSHPSAMTMESVQMHEPCISKRSIASDSEGVIYASPNGIASVGAGLRGLVTEYAYTRDEWQANSPSSMFGKLYGRNFIVFNSSGSALVIPRSDRSGISTLQYPATAFYVDSKTGEIFMTSEIDGLLYRLDADTINSSSYEWKSRLFSVPQPVGFTCLQVNMDTRYLNDQTAINAIVAQIIADNQVKFAAGPVGGQVDSAPFNEYTYNGSNMQDIPTSADARNVTVTILADGVQVFSQPVYSINPSRIASGYKAYDWEVIISGNVPVRSFSMATSIGELKAV